MYEHSEAGAETGELARTVSPDLCSVILVQGVHGNVAIGYWYYTSHLGFDLSLLPMRLLLRTVLRQYSDRTQIVCRLGLGLRSRWRGLSSVERPVEILDSGCCCAVKPG